MIQKFWLTKIASLVKYFDFLSIYLKPHKFKVAILLLLLFGSTGLQLLAPQLIGDFLDQASSGQAINVLFQIAGIYIAIAVLDQLLRLISVYFSEDVAWRTTNQLRADLFQHVLFLDLSLHQKYTVGNMLERIDGDVGELSAFFSQMIVGLVGNALLLLGILGFFLLQAWQIGIIYLVFSIITVYLLSLMRSISVRFWGASREANAELQGFIEEHLLGLEDVRSRGAEAYVLNKLYQKMRTLFHKDRAASMRGTLVFAAILLIFLIATIMIFIFGSFLFTNNLVTIGTIYLYYRYVEMLRDPLQQISHQFEYLQRAVASMNRIKDILALQSDIQDGDKPIETMQCPAIHFKDVCFSYQDDEPVLKNITFTLQGGHSLGLLGRTGSGKSTLGKLVFRFYDPASGTIEFDNQNIKDVAVKSSRGIIALVTQDVQLFQASVRDNLTFFDDTISDERLTDILEEIGLRDWLASLTKGLDTILESGGQGLSAGQAQLLSFARAFLQNPQIVILDEASARLDPITEQWIQQATERLLAGRTSIIIAHRLETIRKVDEIMILSDGRILEHDTYHALEQNPHSHFSQLLRTNRKGLLT